MPALDRSVAAPSWRVDYGAEKGSETEFRAFGLPSFSDIAVQSDSGSTYLVDSRNHVFDFGVQTLFGLKTFQPVAVVLAQSR